MKIQSILYTLMIIFAMLLFPWVIINIWSTAIVLPILFQIPIGIISVFAILGYIFYINDIIKILKQKRSEYHIKRSGR